MSLDNLSPDCAAGCTALGEQLSAYLDGELSEAERQAAEAHLRECPDCRALCDALRAIRRDIAAAELNPPDNLHGQIMLGVRRANRARRLRRITAAASAGIAAMFCFVVIGGAIRSGVGGNNMEADQFLYFADDDAPEQYVVLQAAEKAMGDVTGAVMDTTVDGGLTVVATGRSSAHSPSVVYSGTGTDCAPAEAEAPAIVCAKLPASARDFSVTSPKKAEDAHDANRALNAVCEAEGARLAEMQIGTLCTVEIPVGETTERLVFDMTTGEALNLQAFLGSPDALSVLSRVTGIDLSPDTPYQPTAEGLLLFVADGVVATVPWYTDEVLSACVLRFAMTTLPLCLPEGAEIQYEN